MLDIKTGFKVLLSVFFVLLSVEVISAESVVEVWDHYNVSIRVDSKTAHVTEELSINNIINKPIVPGYGYITLSKEDNSTFMGLPFSSKDNTKGLEIRDVSAKLDDGTRISDVLVEEEPNVTTIKYGLWIPIIPGESRKITIEYTTDDIVEKGLLFDDITYTVQPSSIPIENARIQAQLGDNKHVSYSSQPPISTDDTINWECRDLKDEKYQLDFEYSILPLPRLPLKWANIGWGLIFVIVCFWSYRQWRVK